MDVLPSSTKATQGAYAYQPLPTTGHHIRLLQLQSSPSSPAFCNLSCTLTVHDISSPPIIPYSALSYTWASEDGSTNPASDILVDGQPVPITKNLAAALKQLLRPSVSLWVDALCINQTDLQERSTQVAHMKDVYRVAEKVLVWLGPDEDGTDRDGESTNEASNSRGRAFDLCRALDYPDSSFRSWITSLTSSLGEEAGLAAAASIGWRFLSRVLYCSYWLRVWVIQELAAGSTVREIWRGNDSAAYETVWNTQMMLLQQRNIIVDILGETAFGGSITTALARVGPVGMKTPRGTLGELLWFHRQRRATDARDQVFALVGLITATTETGEEVESFRVDYRDGVKDVYTRAAKHVFRTENELELLGENKWPVVPVERELWLPSWVPDWRAEDGYSAERKSVAGPEEKWHGCFAAMGRDIEHDTRNSVAEYMTLGRGTGPDGGGYEGLVVHGIHISKVQQIGTLLPARNIRRNPSGSQTQTAAKVFIDWLIMFLATGRRNMTGLHSFLDLMTLGGWYLEPELPTRDMLEWVEKGALKTTRYVLSRYGDDRAEEVYRMVPSLRRTERAEDDEFGDEMRAEFTILEAISRCQSRRFVVCENGAIGIASGGVKEGDDLVAVKGCSVPLVFRHKAPIDNETVWENMGDVYLDGYMQGEIMENLHEQDIKDFIIV